jgi:hypothetical protein
VLRKEQEQPQLSSVRTNLEALKIPVELACAAALCLERRKVPQKRMMQTV